MFFKKAVCFLLFFVAFQVEASDSTVLKPILDDYKTYKDIKGSFKQKSIVKDMEKTFQYEGEFFIKIPSKQMFWYYKGDKKQEVYITDNTAIFYQEKHNQAVKTEYNSDTIGQTPLALLSDFERAISNYEAVQKTGYIRLTPNNKDFKINFVDIFVKKDKGVFPIKKIIVNDKNSNEIEIDIFDAKVNTAISDETFVFTVPAGTNIIEN